MPGLAGIITRQPKEAALGELERMLESMRHESFYVVGRWCAPEMGIYAGWVARDGSFSANMPVSNETGDLTLLFSGEDYPTESPIAGLRRRGHEVARAGPGYLVHLAEEDPTFPARVNGIFQGLLVDRRRGSARLFTDRYGLRRLYYHESPDGFYFAGEAKAILAVRPGTRSFATASLAEWVSFGCVIEDRSLFEGIHVLPAASRWQFEGGRLRFRDRFFEPGDWEDQEQLDAETYYREAREAFLRGLPAYLGDEERVGIALTGGLDTRVIMAHQRLAPGKLPCYTFGGSLRDSQDVKIARRVAAACGQPHQVLELHAGFLKEFPHYAARTVYLTDGAAGVANAHDLFVSERARVIAPAKLVGTWGSELLTGAITFRPTRWTGSVLERGFEEELLEAESRYRGVLQCHPLSFGAFRQTAWSHFGVEALEQTQLTIRAPFLSNEFVRIAFRSPRTKLADPRIRMIAEADAGLARIPSDRGVQSSDGDLYGAIRQGVQQFTFKCEYALDMGMPQWLAQWQRFVPMKAMERLVLGRHKFTHFRTWYRNSLAPYVREILLDPQALTRPYLRRDGVRRLVAEHTSGSRNHTNAIHALLSLELAYRSIISHRPAPQDSTSVA